MATTQRANRDNKVNPDRKNIRLMTTGMSICLSIFPAIILAEMFDLRAYISIISVLLAVIGGVFFFSGLVGRQELAAKRREANQRDLSDFNK